MSSCFFFFLIDFVRIQQSKPRPLYIYIYIYREREREMGGGVDGHEQNYIGR